MADKVDQPTYFDDCADQEDQELRQVAKTDPTDSISQFEPLKIAKDSNQGCSDADFSKSSKNSPSELQNLDTTAKIKSQSLTLDAPKPMAMALHNPAKLLEMVNIQADDSSSCK